MSIKINFDSSYIPEKPTLILANRNGEKLGLIPAKDIIVKDSLNNAPEISFCVYKYENDIKNEIWDKIVDYRLLWCKEWDTWFEITIEISESNKTVKNVSCIQLAHAELSQTNLYNIEINTENDIARDDYEITVLFDSNNHNSSLLHRIMEKVPHYSIDHVDYTIANIQRTFSFDDICIYDAFQEISEEIGCLFRFNSGTKPDGSIQRSISVYDLQSRCLNSDCNYRGEFTGKCPKCGSVEINEGFGQDTTIFITSDELAEEIQLTTDNDSVKNCFKLEAGDDLMTATVRNCNPNGSDYIWHIPDDMKSIMSDGLVEKLKEYDNQYSYYQNEYIYSVDDDIIQDDMEMFIRRDYNMVADLYNMTGIPPFIKGYPALMNTYYNTIDFELYLRSSMMPEVTIQETSADNELENLMEYFKQYKYVAVSDVSNISLETAKSSIVLLVRTIVDSRYQIDVEGHGLNSQVWKGKFTITNSNKTESASTQQDIEITLTDGQELFLKQSIEKMLNKNHKDDVGISDIFQLNNEDFCLELKKYCLNRLTSFLDACKSCIDILENQGVSDGKTWSGSDDEDNLYKILYIPYKEKLKIIESEINERNLQLDIISKMQNRIQKERDFVQDKLNFENFIKKDNGESLWIEFCSYRREDKYSNSNYISDGLSNTELFEKAIEFIEVANTELYKSAEFQHSISTSLKNLLVMEKFNPLIQYFEVGNWVRIQVNDNIYKLRMVEYEINYEELNTISVGFSDLLKTLDGVSDMESVIQNITSISKSYSSVQRQASQGSKGNSVLQTWVEDGLEASKVKIMNANNQTQTWDEHGMLFRQYNYADDTYSPNQMKITNSSILFTSDDWNTVKTAIGNICYIDPVSKKLMTSYGINGETIVGKLLLGQHIGIHNEDGSLTFDKNGLIVKNDITAFYVTPNDEDALISITTKKDDKEEKIFYVDSSGNLFIKGNGKHLDLSENQGLKDSLLEKVSIGDIGCTWNNITSQVQLESGKQCDELCFYTEKNTEIEEPEEYKKQRLSTKVSHEGFSLYDKGELIGKLKTSVSEQNTTKKGIVFDLTDNCDYISFTQTETSDNSSKDLFSISKGGIKFDGKQGVTDTFQIISAIETDSDGNITPVYTTVTVENGIITDISDS